ncbi:hypothetical protein GE09DRAFT_222926 [Coniochaeta sp. 2T2.1]|nr:hypothetical protein GE09DRAFT_222926 [Coniochaeta sp. 2T2.1]
MRMLHSPQQSGGPPRSAEPCDLLAKYKIPSRTLGSHLANFHFNFLQARQASVEDIKSLSHQIINTFAATTQITMRVFSAIPTVSILLLASEVIAGPVGYGVCQGGCAGVVMACYGAAGFTWGATLGATAPASILACNAAYGSCQAACAAVLLVPLP